MALPGADLAHLGARGGVPAHQHPPGVAAAAAARESSGPARDAVERLYRSLKDPGTQRAVLRLYRATDMAAVAEDLHRRLQGLDRPVLVVWGRHDPYLPVAHAERQRGTFPRAEVVVLDDSGHWPMLDDPVGVEQAVLPFLARVTAGDAATAQ